MADAVVAARAQARRALVTDVTGAMALTVGTAGHIDHGKTWLVRALTGKDTDRLPEEQRRGISIDLGYAPLELPDGRRLSLVDVPGHERFVRTMVAGATGIDLFLLVIDAAEGARPQTLEHLAILRLLGVERGVVAVTKADLVDAETLEIAMEEARELVPGAEVVAVSAKTGAGLDELRAALARVADARDARATPAARRACSSTASSPCAASAPSSRARSGRARSARATCCKSRPRGGEVRVRTVQVHDTAVERATAGAARRARRCRASSGASCTGRCARHAGCLSRLVPAGRRARGADADRRRRARLRASRDLSRPRPGRAGR